jgi:hypothetical protein
MHPHPPVTNTKHFAFFAGGKKKRFIRELINKPKKILVCLLIIEE